METNVIGLLSPPLAILSFRLIEPRKGCVCAHAAGVMRNPKSKNQNMKAHSPRLGRNLPFGQTKSPTVRCQILEAARQPRGVPYFGMNLAPPWQRPIGFPTCSFRRAEDFRGAAPCSGSEGGRLGHGRAGFRSRGRGFVCDGQVAVALRANSHIHRVWVVSDRGSGVYSDAFAEVARASGVSPRGPKGRDRSAEGSARGIPVQNKCSLKGRDNLPA